MSIDEILNSVLLIFAGAFSKYLFDEIIVVSRKELNFLRGEISMNLTMYSNVYSNFNQDYIKNYFEKKKNNLLSDDDIDAFKEIQKISTEFRKLASKLISAANTLRWWQFSPVTNADLANAASNLIGLSNFTSSSNILISLQNVKEIKRLLNLKY